MIAIKTISLDDFSCLSVNKNEVMRYLGVKEEDESFATLYEQGKSDAFSLAMPRAVYTKTEIKTDGCAVDFGFMRVNSKNLAKNLCDCKEAYIFCATLGIGMDRHFERTMRISQARGTVFSAVASSLIESFCDYVNEELCRNLDVKPRFSCGYGDFCLEHQRDILNVLEANKRLGICLTDSCMMVPVKSVTAIIGIRR